jgi:hypothetical protein
MHGNNYFGQSSYAAVGVGISSPPPPPYNAAINSSEFVDLTVNSTLTAGMCILQR